MPYEYNPEKHHRRSVRLKEFDYKQSGAYFVTICTQNRECLFGTAADRGIQLSDSGRMVQAAWQELPSRFSNISLHAFVVMPNHIHGIIQVGAQLIAPSSRQEESSAPRQEGAINRAPTLGGIVRAYKASSTRLIRSTANANFAWQRNYYEHIIRDEESLNRIRQYILDNPVSWSVDPENPHATTPEPENV